MYIISRGHLAEQVGGIGTKWKQSAWKPTLDRHFDLRYENPETASDKPTECTKAMVKSAEAGQTSASYSPGGIVRTTTPPHGRLTTKSTMWACPVSLCRNAFAVHAASFFAGSYSKNVCFWGFAVFALACRVAHGSHQEILGPVVVSYGCSVCIAGLGQGGDRLQELDR